MVLYNCPMRLIENILAPVLKRGGSTCFPHPTFRLTLAPISLADTTSASEQSRGPSAQRLGNPASSKRQVAIRSDTASQPGYWKTALTKEASRARRIFSWRNQLIGRTYLSTTPTIKHATQLANKVERLIQKEMMLRVFHLNHFKLRLE